MSLQILHVVRFEYHTTDPNDLNFYDIVKDIGTKLWKDFPTLSINTSTRGLSWGAIAEVEGPDQVEVHTVATVLYRRIRALPGAEMLNPKEL